MEAALVEMASASGLAFAAARRIAEIPFDGDRMRHSVLYEAGGGLVLYCKGAPEALLPLCRDMLYDGRAVPLHDATRQAIVQAQEAMAEKGLRILAFAMRRPTSAGPDALIE